MIDTHCHLTFEPLDQDVAGVVERSRAAGVTGWITVGTSLGDSRKAIEVAGRHDRMHAAIGIHPHEAKAVDDTAMAELKRLGQSPKVVAVGETGLDFHYNFSKQPDQRRVFAAHLEMAKELKLPVIIHSRNAFDETVEILREQDEGLVGVVFHCFSGTAEQAQLLLDSGYYLSFTGVVTFKNAQVTREAARVVPLERLMIETDSPYMSPEPVRHVKPNEPALMVHTARLVAELKGISLEELDRGTSLTAQRFFNLTHQTELSRE